MKILGTLKNSNTNKHLIVCNHLVSILIFLPVAIYSVPDGTMTTMFEGQTGGITHLAFSKDGNYLFAGGRKVS